LLSLVRASRAAVACPLGLILLQPSGGFAMLDTAIQVNLFLMQYCRMLVGDIPDERMAEQPHAGVNHPAWILGHLALMADGTLDRLGGQKALPAEWATLFAAGSKPSASRGAYPAKDALLRAAEESYQQVRHKAATATPEQLSRPTANPRAREVLPTSKEMLAFLLSGHMGVHLGQLSSWRRMIGLPPMF
jgi:DinB superfamily